ncbi:Zinc finger, RING/FYVE/PHD-type [Phytophthora cinnamomi]|uniref:Zinc finger, RING/FYVE/PHD-type n=1 Tax=Phytophthora cinnamomi TaxID=4785 RepID=UPI003559FE28|nr:Zinc finger, RING/FYVE/PHD-type [Phytophthora cinnamomi]
MNKCSLAPGVVPERMRLSEEKKQAIIDVTDGLIAETLHTYEFFVANGRQLPSDQWRHVKSKEKVRVYRSRRGKVQKLHSQSHDEKDPSRPRLMSAGAMEHHQRQAAASGRPYAYDDPVQDEDVSTNTNSSSSDAGSFTLSDDSVLAKVKPSHSPLIVATGQIDGTIEDVAFGALANTKSSWLVRTSYVHNDHFFQRRVLATLQAPSEEDPFRAMTVKWGAANYGTLTTNRDLLYVESMGMAFDSDGERIFYYIIHSVELEDFPQLELNHGLVRINLSVAYVVRQITPDTVELFARGFADARGDMMEGYAVMLLANNVLSCAGIVECSNLKKLSYLMALRRRSDASGIESSSKCGVCSKSLSKLGTLLQSSSGCPVCRRVTCSKCSVQKKISVDVCQEDVTQKTFTFCLPCVIEAKELSAWEVASACLASS